MARDDVNKPFTGSTAVGEEPIHEYHGKDAHLIDRVTEDDGRVGWNGTLGSMLTLEDGEPDDIVHQVNDVSGIPLLTIYNSGKVEFGIPLFTNFVFDPTDQSYSFNGDKLKVLQEVELNLTNAQILALNTTPIEVIPAPGAGKAIQVMSVVSVLKSTVAYATNTAMRLVSGAGHCFEDTATLTLAADTNVCWEQVGGAELVVNDPVDITVNTGDPTGGDAGNTLKVIVQYVIVDVT